MPQAIQRPATYADIEALPLTNTFVDTEDVCAPPFDAITFSLGLLWPFDPPSDSSASEPAT